MRFARGIRSVAAVLSWAAKASTKRFNLSKALSMYNLQAFLACEHRKG
uniref:Uncharacterized protein n=1 Tax=Rhizophora mucronata TaxID=61149 RepID=A0A2P2Q6B4_RHIMU